MVLAEIPRPAETISPPVNEQMQVKIDTLQVSGVDALLEEHIPHIQRTESLQTNQMVDIIVTKRPSVRIDTTASVGINILYSGGEKPTTAVPLVRVEALDTQELVVAYMDQSSPHSREHRWVSLAEHAQVEGLPDVENFLAVPISSDASEEQISRQDILRSQIEHAIQFAKDKRRREASEPIDIVTFW